MCSRKTQAMRPLPLLLQTMTAPLLLLQPRRVSGLLPTQRTPLSMRHRTCVAAAVTTTPKKTRRVLSESSPARDVTSEPLWIRRRVDEMPRVSAEVMFRTPSAHNEISGLSGATLSRLMAALPHGYGGMAARFEDALAKEWTEPLDAREAWAVLLAARWVHKDVKVPTIQQVHAQLVADVDGVRPDLIAVEATQFKYPASVMTSTEYQKYCDARRRARRETKKKRRDWIKRQDAIELYNKLTPHEKLRAMTKVKKAPWLEWFRPEFWIVTPGAIREYLRFRKEDDVYSKMSGVVEKIKELPRPFECALTDVTFGDAEARRGAENLERAIGLSLNLLNRIRSVVPYKPGRPVFSKHDRAWTAALVEWAHVDALLLKKGNLPAVYDAVLSQRWADETLAPSGRAIRSRLLEKTVKAPTLTKAAREVLNIKGLKRKDDVIKVLVDAWANNTFDLDAFYAHNVSEADLKPKTARECLQDSKWDRGLGSHLDFWLDPKNWIVSPSLLHGITRTLDGEDCCFGEEKQEQHDVNVVVRPISSSLNMTALLARAPPFVKTRVLELPKCAGERDIMQGQRTTLSLSNFGNITGIPLDVVNRILSVAPSPFSAKQYDPVHGDIWQSKILKWQNIKKGKDLRIRGMGSFDIANAYDTLLDLRWKQHSLQKTKATTTDVWRDTLSVVKRDVLIRACFEHVNDDAYDSKKKRTKSMTKTEALDFLFASRGDDDSSSSSSEHNFGHFDPSKFYRTLKDSDVVKIDRRPRWAYLLHPYFWVLTPLEVSAFGYFQKELVNLTDNEMRATLEKLMAIFAKPDSNLGKSHLVRHKTWWHDHLNQLDELVAIASMARVPLEWPDLAPPALLRSFRAREAERKAVGIKNVKYDWLDSLKPPSPLRVLRNAQDCVDCGRILHNCASMYSPRIANQQCILVALDDSKVVSMVGQKKTPTDATLVKPIALGEFRNNKGFTQISETCNRSPSLETRAVFNNYANDLQAWWDTYLLEKRREAARKAKDKKHRDSIVNRQ